MRPVEGVPSKSRRVMVLACLAVALPLVLLGGSCSSGQHGPATTASPAAQAPKLAATPPAVVAPAAAVQATPVPQPPPVPTVAAAPAAKAAPSGRPSKRAAEVSAGPPSDHTKAKHGVLHRPGAKHPFEQGCPACHGADLSGSDGSPSCFKCHGRRWRD